MATFKHNKVDIYIKERSGTREIRVPWLPETIGYASGGATTASYDILNRGEVQVPSGSGLAVISWSSVLPGKNRTDNSMLRGTWNAPSHYHKIFESWRANGTSLNIMVTGYPINKDVYLSDYTCKPSGGFGDMEYSVEFTETREITITSKKSTNSTKRPASKTTAYKIKRGDTLWGIAQRFLGSGAKWRTIYNANKSIIESTAKKRGFSSSNNGWWIFPGVTIQIPQ